MLLHQETTDLILNCFYTVYNKLRFGFLEKVYENFLIIEITNAGLKCQQQFSIPVLYDKKVVGNYFADLFVDNKILIELKAAESIVREHELQLTNYLKATNIEVGLLLNFGKKPEFKRRIFTNDYK
jgi:GxxExxY protein